jgi:cytochrome c biogenesis protein
MAAPPVSQPRLGPLGTLRFVWRQLTSMRTALLLLLLLAVAAIPGSIYPQRGIDPVRVREYLDEHPGLGPWLDRVGMFDVYASPWFAAIYLLLMVSLVGCILPRSRQHIAALRARPPRTPRNLGRLPAYRREVVAAAPDQVLDAASGALRRRRYRVRVDEDRPAEVAAEGGYLKETGNLFFHISLLAVIVSVGAGHLLGWRGEIILPEGQTFTSTVGRYDTLQAGPWVDLDDIEPFVLTLDDLEVEFETENQAQLGAPRTFSATVTTAPEPGGEATERTLAVNHPLDLGSPSVYLLGNGYAVVVTVRDADGEVVYRQPTPFLPQDDNYSSTGAIKVPGVEPNLGFYGQFLPTLTFDPQLGPVSVFPGLQDPGLVLGVYEGELFPEGRPQSVYSLDVASMDEVFDEDGERSRVLLRPGETVELPGGRGSIELEEVVRWGGLAVRHDPGRIPVLVSSIVLLASLMAMLMVRRRRLFVRVVADPDAPAGHTVVEVAGLAKGADATLQDSVDALLERITEAVDAPTAAATTKDG